MQTQVEDNQRLQVHHVIDTETLPLHASPWPTRRPTHNNLDSQVGGNKQRTRGHANLRTRAQQAPAQKQQQQQQHQHMRALGQKRKLSAHKLTEPISATKVLLEQCCKPPGPARPPKFQPRAQSSLPNPFFVNLRVYERSSLSQGACGTSKHLTFTAAAPRQINEQHF